MVITVYLYIFKHKDQDKN